MTYPVHPSLPDGPRQTFSRRRGASRFDALLDQVSALHERAQSQSPSGLPPIQWVEYTDVTFAEKPQAYAATNGIRARAQRRGLPVQFSVQPVPRAQGQPPPTFGVDGSPEPSASGWRIFVARAGS